jgi:hypothetical protein
MIQDHHSHSRDEKNYDKRLVDSAYQNDQVSLNTIYRKKWRNKDNGTN